MSAPPSLCSSPPLRAGRTVIINHDHDDQCDEVAAVLTPQLSSDSTSADTLLKYPNIFGITWSIPITLNVGGKFVEVDKTTLMRAGYFQNYFKRNLNGTGPFFIDVDHESFKHIIRKWRYPEYVLPAGDTYIQYV